MAEGEAGMTESRAAVPGLYYLAGWLDPDGQRALLAEIDASPWSTELRRRGQHYGHKYDYGRPASSAEEAGTATPVPAWAAVLADRLHVEGYTDRVADQMIVNEYQPGQGISAHVDCVPCFGPAVAAVSLGSGCAMEFTSPDRADRVEV